MVALASGQTGLWASTFISEVYHEPREFDIMLLELKLVAEGHKEQMKLSSMSCKASESIHTCRRCE